MTTRLIAATAVAALVLAGCAQTTDGTPASGADAGFPSTVTALAAKLKAGTASVRSTHLTLKETIAGQSISGDGDETLSNGKPTAMSLQLSVPGFGALQVLRAGGHTYLKLPAGQRSSDKPWALVSTSSSNPVVRAMAGSLASADQMANLDSAAIFVQATRNLKYLGPSTVSGTATGHYSLTVDVDRLPADFPQKQLLTQGGLRRLPIELWVDTAGRMRKLTEQVRVIGQTASTVLTLGNYDAPVHISPPPADQVDTS